MSPVLTDDQIKRIAKLAVHGYMTYHHLDWRDIPDAFSDAYLGIAQALTRVDRDRPPSEIEGYVYLRAKGALIDGLRKRAEGFRTIAGVRPKSFSTEYMTEFGFALTDPREWIKQADDRALVRDILSRMSSDERLLCTATYIYGFTLAEAGEMIGLTKMQAHWIRLKACQRVKKEFISAARA